MKAPGLRPDAKYSTRNESCMRILLIIIITIISSQGSYGQMLQFDHQDVFINGINLPWRHFGRDLGGTGQYDFDSLYFKQLFADLSAHGINAVRMWVHCDGRFSPFRDRDGFVVGLPRDFIDDFKLLLHLAERHELMILPVLWTFEMVDHRLVDLIRDPVKTTSYIDQALIPLIQATKNHCNILAWEIINEPEWAMDIGFGGTTKNKVTAEEMQRFVGMQAHAIHNHSDQMVTVGSAGLRFNNDIFLKSKNYWHDTKIQAQNLDCDHAYLDFYSIHYYRWTLEPLSPFRQECADFHLDKPVLIGEFGKHKKEPVQDLIKKAHQNGYAGTMPWSIAANDGVGNWADYGEGIADFAASNPSILASGYCTYRDKEPAARSCIIYPNPASDELWIENHNDIGSSLTVELISLMGKRVKKWTSLNGALIGLEVASLPQGSYLVRIYYQNHDELRLLSQQKLMILHR